MDLNTKVYLEIQIKGYPVGKNVRCYIWFEDYLLKEQVEKKLANIISLNDKYKNEKIHKIKVFNCFQTNTKKDDEKFNELIETSVIDAVNLKFLNDTKPSKKEKTETIETIRLDNLKDDELSKLHRYVINELTIRKYNLTKEEFIFYQKYKEELDLNTVKNEFQKCKGDIVILRKNKIRDKLISLNLI